MDFVNSWDDNYKDGGIHYLRIGEDYDDIEEIVYGEPMKYIHLFRYMKLE
jgi:hypothetical protein